MMRNASIEIGTEKRSQPTSWDLLRLTPGALGENWLYGQTAAYLAENLSVVLACVQAIAETVAMLPLHVYRTNADGSRTDEPNHPVAALFSGNVSEWQTGNEFLETQLANCLLQGNAYAEIIRDGRGAPTGLTAFPPGAVFMVYLPGLNTYAYDLMPLHGMGSRRILPADMLHLKDRSDDGIIGRSRLSRARETFGSALSTERFANKTFENGASMSGILSHPDKLGQEAAENLRRSFSETYSGVDNAGKVAVLEEGLKWQQISVSPEDAQMLESRRFSVEEIARIFRVPPPIIGDFGGGNYAALQEISRWFYTQSIQPWLNRWERLIEASLFSDATRRQFEVEFDADLLLRGDMLTRFQAYRIGRETGLYSANDLRRFENLNPRTDPEGDDFLTPTNMQPEQTGRPAGDRTPGGVAKE
jgi:HK97 family phage portal protein